MSQKNVGILTFHDADNLGAVLQAFALQTTLDKKCGVAAEVIDYKCDKILSTKRVKKPKSVKDFIKYPLMSVYYWIKRRGFSRFRKEYLKSSPQSYDLNNIKNCELPYDMIISGSDQVFNTECSGDDYTYFLDFAKAKKISYAASIGKHKFNDAECEKIVPIIKDFKAVSVREESAKAELERIGITDVQVHPDPVVLLKNEEWQKYKTKRLLKKPYVLVYLVLPDDNVLNCAKQYAKKHGLKVICNKKSAKFIFHNSPREFLSWVYNAECVFTNSFHGTAFSLIFNKPLAADIKLLSGGINNRINDFLNKTNTLQCVLDKDNINPVKPNAQKSLNNLRELGINFLKTQCE